MKGGAFNLRQPALLALGDDRLSERMLGLGFDSCSQLQQRQCGCIRVAAEVHDATINDHISDSRLTLGECPGLVEGHHLYRGRALEMDAAFKQDPAPGRATDRGQDGSRRTDNERARRRHNHHGHGAVERGLKRFLQEQDWNDNQPDREKNDTGCIELLGTVEKALRVGFFSLCFFDHAHQFFNGGILRELCDADLQSTGLIDRASEHGISNLFRHRHRLSCQRRLIDGACSLDNNAVERNAFTGSNNEHITNNEFPHGEQHGSAIAPRKSLLRTQFHERLDRFARAVDRVGLQHIGKREKEEQHRSFERRVHDRGPKRGEHHQQINIDGPLPQRLQPGAHAEVTASEIGAEVKDIVPGNTELGGCPTSDHEGQCKNRKYGFEPRAGCPVLQPFADGFGLVLRFYTIGLDRRARFPDPLNHLLLGETRVIKSHRHNTAEKRGSRTPDTVDLLRFLFQFLFRRARGASAEA